MPTFDDVFCYVQSLDLDPVVLPAQFLAISALATQDLDGAFFSEPEPLSLDYYPVSHITDLNALDLQLIPRAHAAMRRMIAPLYHGVASFFAGEKGVCGRGDLLPAVLWQDSLVASILAACPQDTSDLCVYLSQSVIMRLFEGELDPALKDTHRSYLASYLFENTPVTKVCLSDLLFERGADHRVFHSHLSVYSRDSEAIAVVSSNALSFALEESVKPRCYYDPTKSCLALSVRPPSLYLKVKKGQEGNVVRIKLPPRV